MQKTQKQIKVTVTQFRNNLFNYLDSVFLNKQSMVVEKGGMPIAFVSPVVSSFDEDANKERLGKLREALNATRSLWAEDDWLKTQKRREKIESRLSKERKNQW